MKSTVDPNSFPPVVGKTEDGKVLKRPSWGNQVEFVLTLAGLAVGLGNVWRFPYLCYSNGGGAFLIPYFGALFLVGIPIFFMELSIGQFSSKGTIAVWDVNPLFRGLGISAIAINTMIGVYYNVIIAWTLHYLIASLALKLPWEDCGNPWNTELCCNNKVLKISGGIETQGGIVWELALCHLVSWIVVFLVLVKGISSLGKVVYFSTIFPYVLLTVMLVRGVTLDGAYEGIVYYLRPDFTKLANGKTWGDASTQIIFSLSLCTGGMITLSSFNPFKNNALRDSLLVPVINSLTSIYGGFAIFSVLGYMAKQKNVPISHVAQEGTGLVFVVYPEALTTMPIAPLWSSLFFLMMATLGFSSQFSQAEITISAFVDNFPCARKSQLHFVAARAITCLLFFLAGLTMVTNGGLYVLSLLDGYVARLPMLIVGLLECVVIQYIYGYSNFACDIEMMLGRKPSTFYRITWCFVSPLVLFAVAVSVLSQYRSPRIYNKQLPSWAEGLGWTLASLIIMITPAWFVGYIFQNGGWQLVRSLSRPTREWGPSLEENKTGKYFRRKHSSSSDNITREVNYYEELNNGLKSQTGKITTSLAKHEHVNDSFVFECDKF